MKKVNLSIEKKSYGVRESIRTLRTNLQFCGDDKRVILVTSCVPREGKSSVSVALAESIADMGKSVILVDADIRNSVMASKLQITGADKGLSHFLSGQCVLADVIMATNIPKFHILLSGPEAPNPTELLESERFTGMLESMKNVMIILSLTVRRLVLLLMRQSSDIRVMARSLLSKPVRSNTVWCRM